MAYGEGMGGLGLVDRIKKTLEGRANAIKTTIKDAKEVAKAQKPLVPGAILSNQVNNMRKANQELVPSVKELIS